MDCCSIELLAVVVALGIALKFLFGWHQKQTRLNNQIRWNAAGKDVVVLHQFPRARTCPNPSPYPIKLETFLRMHSIKYINDFEEPMSEKGKSPWITLNGENVADSQLAIEFLAQKFNLDINKGLTRQEVIMSKAMRILIEQDLYWALACGRWIHRKARDVTTYFAPIFKGLPRSVEAFIITHLYSRMVEKQAIAQGMGRHSQSQVEKMGLEDVKDLSDFLGEKKFTFGDEPTMLDCTLFGFMCMFMYCSPADSLYTRTIRKEHQNLVDFTERMKEKYWPDWEQAKYH